MSDYTTHIEYCLFYRALLQKRPIILFVCFVDYTTHNDTIHQTRGMVIQVVYIYILLAHNDTKMTGLFCKRAL